MSTPVIDRHPAAPRPAGSRPPRTPVLALPEARWAAAALALFAAGGLIHLLGGPVWLYWALYLACYAAGGWDPALSGLRALREKSLDVDLLMVLAAIGAAAIGQIFDGALLIVIFATSGALEALATRRTEDSVRGLLTLAPDTGTRITPGGTEETVTAEDLRVGEEILVRPGERIAADGPVVSGSSDVDQATITGEPLPAPKAIGDEVFAGTLNGTGTLRVRVGRPAHDTVVARIAGQVDRASATKAKTQLFIERFEQRYSVGVVAATLAIFTVPLLFGADFSSALLRAMTFMIVASPCAVVLATMPPLLAAISTASRHGVLVKNAVVLERLADTTTAALDKTGTLTTGRPRLAAIRRLGDDPAEESEVLGLAAAAELGSEHPISQAIVTAARDRCGAIPEAGGFAALPGRGVAATVEGHRVEVGALERIGAPDRASREDFHAAAQAVRTLEDEGHTAVAVLSDGRPVAVLGVLDTPRADAAGSVRRLDILTGTAPVLLTGDNPRAARRVADAVGMDPDRVHAELLPEDKAAAVESLGTGGGRVLLVGDGINDAPAMATAHTAVAMGGTGSDLALETSDAVVVRDELDAVPTVVALSRRARRVVIANLAIAGTVIAALVAWDLVGYLPLVLGVAGHELSTVLVALNGMRLLRGKAWRAAQAEARG